MLNFFPVYTDFPGFDNNLVTFAFRSQSEYFTLIRNAGILSCILPSIISHKHWILGVAEGNFFADCNTSVGIQTPRYCVWVNGYVLINGDAKEGKLPSISNTDYRACGSKMKSFIVATFFAVFVAYVRADDLTDIDDDSNEPGYVVS